MLVKITKGSVSTRIGVLKSGTHEVAEDVGKTLLKFGLAAMVEPAPVEEVKEPVKEKPASKKTDDKSSKT